MSVARRRRLATIELAHQFHASLRDAGTSLTRHPPLKGRAKFVPTLRVEET